ncbi:hypothetical protein [Methanococcus vannielii]|jgi:hypothetical protein|nr:hypothetical protein [Methanococcus vannielii]
MSKDFESCDCGSSALQDLKDHLNDLDSHLHDVLAHVGHVKAHSDEDNIK